MLPADFADQWQRKVSHSPLLWIFFTRDAKGRTCHVKWLCCCLFLDCWGILLGRIQGEKKHPLLNRSEWNSENLGCSWNFSSCLLPLTGEHQGWSGGSSKQFQFLTWPIRKINCSPLWRGSNKIISGGIMSLGKEGQTWEKIGPWRQSLPSTNLGNWMGSLQLWKSQTVSKGDDIYCGFVAISPRWKHGS